VTTQDTIGKSNIGAALQATQSSIRSGSKSGGMSTGIADASRAQNSAMREAVKTGIGQSSKDTQSRIRESISAITASPPERQPMRFAPPFSEQFDRSIDELSSRAGGGGGGYIPPLTLEQVDTENVKVRTGTVGGHIPTDVNTNLDVSGTDGTWYIYLEASLDADGDVTGASIDGNTTGVPADSSSTAYYLVGTATVAAGEITAVAPTLAFSQEFAACGRDPDDTGTTPGTYSFFVA
jgi:hypothetical protein